MGGEADADMHAMAAALRVELAEIKARPSLAGAVRAAIGQMAPGGLPAREAFRAAALAWADAPDDVAAQDRLAIALAEWVRPLAAASRHASWAARQGRSGAAAAVPPERDDLFGVDL